MNTSVPEGFKYSSFELMFGRAPFTHIDLMYQIPVNSSSQDVWLENLFRVRESAALLDKEAKSKFKQSFDEKVITSF